METPKPDKSRLTCLCTSKLTLLPPLTFADAEACGLSALVLEMRDQLTSVQAELGKLAADVKKNSASSALHSHSVQLNKPTVAEKPTTTKIRSATWADAAKPD